MNPSLLILRPWETHYLTFVRRNANDTIIAIVMQTIDSKYAWDLWNDQGIADSKEMAFKIVDNILSELGHKLLAQKHSILL